MFNSVSQIQPLRELILPDNKEISEITAVRNSEKKLLSLFPPAAEPSELAINFARTILATTPNIEQQKAQLIKLIKEKNVELVTALLHEKPALAEQTIEIKQQAPDLFVGLEGRSVNLLDYALLEQSNSDMLFAILRQYEKNNQWFVSDTTDFLINLIEPKPWHQHNAFTHYLHDTLYGAEDKITLLAQLMPIIQDKTFWTSTAKELNQLYFFQKYKGVTLFFTALKTQNWHALTVLIERVLTIFSSHPEFIARFINTKDEHGNTLLHYLYLHPDLISALPESAIKYFDMTITNQEGQTALSVFFEAIKDKGATSRHKLALERMLNNFFEFTSDQKTQAKTVLNSMKEIIYTKKEESTLPKLSPLFIPNTTAKNSLSILFDNLPISSEAYTAALHILNTEPDTKKLKEILCRSICEGNANLVAALLTLCPRIANQSLEIYFINWHQRQIRELRYHNLIKEAQLKVAEPDYKISPSLEEKAKNIIENTDRKSVINALFYENTLLLNAIFKLSPTFIKNEIDLVQTTIKQHPEKEIRRKHNDLLEYGFFKAANAETLFVLVSFFAKQKQWSSDQILDNLFGFSQGKNQQYMLAFEYFLASPRENTDLALAFLSLFIPHIPNNQTFPWLVGLLAPEVCQVEKLADVLFDAIKVRNWHAAWGLLAKAADISKNAPDYFTRLLEQKNSNAQPLKDYAKRYPYLEAMINEAKTLITQSNKVQKATLNNIREIKTKEPSIHLSCLPELTEEKMQEASDILTQQSSLKNQYIKVREAIKANDAGLIAAMLQHYPTLLEQEIPVGGTHRKIDILEYTLLKSKDLMTINVVIRYFTRHFRWGAKQLMYALVGMKNRGGEEDYSSILIQILTSAKREANLQLALINQFMPLIDNDDDSMAHFFTAKLNLSHFQTEQIEESLLFNAAKCGNHVMLKALLHRLTILEQEQSGIFQQKWQQKDTEGHNLLHYCYDKPKLLQAISNFQPLIELDSVSLKVEKTIDAKAFVNLPFPLISRENREQAQKLIGQQPSLQNISLRQAIKANNAALTAEMIRQCPTLLDQSIPLEGKTTVLDLLEYTLLKCKDLTTINVVLRSFKHKFKWTTEQLLSALTGIEGNLHKNYSMVFSRFLKNTQPNADMQIDFINQFLPNIDIHDEAMSHFITRQLNPSYFKHSTPSGSLLLNAAKQGNYYMIENLFRILATFKNTHPNLSEQIINEQDAQGNCLLHYCYEQPNIIQAFNHFESALDMGFNSRAVNHAGQTPLGKMLDCIETIGIKINSFSTIHRLLEMTVLGKNEPVFNHDPKDIQRAKKLLRENSGC